MPFPPKDLPNRGQILADNPTLIDRFESYIEKPNGEMRCWQWTGYTKSGYGYIGIKMRGRWHNIGAHRISFVLTYGGLTQGRYVAHLCNNPPCVNPEHLYACTHRQNMVDREVSRRLRQYGAEHGLTDEEIIVGRIPRWFLEEEEEDEED